MLNKKSANGTIVDRVQSVSLQTSKESQHFGTIARLPIALEESICAGSVENLNQVLADTKTLTDMYKKHHWQVSGPTFYQLHLLYDKHFKEQSGLVDALAERIQSLGGVSIAMAHDVAEMTLIPRVPGARACRRSSLACCTPTSSSSKKPARWPGRRPRPGMTERTTSW